MIVGSFPAKLKSLTYLKLTLNWLPICINMKLVAEQNSGIKTLHCVIKFSEVSAPFFNAALTVW